MTPRTATWHGNIVARYYKLIDRNAVDELLALFHEEVRYDRVGTPPINGHRALERFYRCERGIESGRHQVDALLSNNEWVVARGSFVGRLRSGEEVDIDWTDWHHFRDGLIDYRQSLFPGRRI